MDRSDRPSGRKKRIGAGGGGVFRRGEGRGGQTGGPVGDAGGYSGRESQGTLVPEPREAPSGGGARSGGGLGGLLGGLSGAAGTGSGSGGRRAPGLGCSPKLIIAGIVIIGIIVVLVYLLSGLGGGEEPSLQPGATGTTLGTAPPSTLSTVDPGSSPVVTAVSQQARAKRTVLKGGGNDTATVMVYLCGTDLEAQGGMATADLNEMLYAEDSTKVNVVVETGGTARWRNSVISSQTNQRYLVTSGGLQLLQGDLGKRSMVDPATLADFIRYSKARYPADRYVLVLWDHGGGSLTGYGFDQNFQKDSMTLDEIATGLRNGGCTFDVIGFDACLMATLETAMVLEPYADYMLASEETEPGIGWHYTGWLTALAQNSSVSTTDLGKRVIDDYIADCRSQVPQSQATLSLIDLAEFKGTVPSSFATFASSTSGLIDANAYDTVSNARADAKEFARDSQINQIDLIDFAEKLGTPEAKTFANVLRGCIKYNRTSANISNSNGVSIYFPYNRLSQLNSALATYNAVGIPPEYSECIRSFASMAAGGQVTSSNGGDALGGLLGSLLGGGQPGGGSGGAPGGSGGGAGAGAVGALLEAFLNRGDFSRITGGGQDWLDVERMRSSVDYYAANRFDPAGLAIVEKSGQRVISLTDKQWSLVQFMEMNVFLDDGEGFIDLGLDNVYDYNDDGDLLMEYDGTWLALNGQIVPYYLVSDDRDGDNYAIKGRVPALLNDRLVDIVLSFTDEKPDGEVLGARPKYDPATESATLAKGLIAITAGDKIDYLCDYYTYEGKYDDTFFLGDQYTATGAWTIENLSVGDLDYKMTYRFTDIYGNRYWTEPVSD